MKIHVLIENTKRDECIICEHGLSLYIGLDDQYYLIDAGSTSSFLKNADMLHVDLNKVQACFLSHGHYDHSGGFSAFTSLYKKPIYCMDSVMDSYYSGSNDHIHYIGVPADFKDIKNIHTIHEVTKINESVYCIPHSTHNLEFIGKNKKLYKYIDNTYIPDNFHHEMSIVFKTSKGLIIVNSCCHAGLENVIHEVQDVFPNEKIYAFIGGLHMKGKKEGKEICTFNDRDINQLSSFINDLNLKVYTGHCTGEIGYSLLKERCNSIHSMYTGMSFDI